MCQVSSAQCVTASISQFPIFTSTLTIRLTEKVLIFKSSQPKVCVRYSFLGSYMRYSSSHRFINHNKLQCFITLHHTLPRLWKTGSCELQSTPYRGRHRSATLPAPSTLYLVCPKNLNVNKCVIKQRSFSDP